MFVFLVNTRYILALTVYLKSLLLSCQQWWFLLACFAKLSRCFSKFAPIQLREMNNKTISFSILVALFACQNGVLIGILSAEYGLFTSSIASGSNTGIGHRFNYPLIIKNSIFLICYVVLLFVCVRSALKAMIDFIVSCCYSSVDFLLRSYSTQCGYFSDPSGHLHKN